ncbi:MAG TPA: serine/threonine-protein kinase [Anaerolineae bacterium]|nr:serine/threonine-protein kinase [Anaerolineae bacterium]
MMRGGAYRILEPLGRGGMGALYLAADTGAFDRKCVVKELLDYYDPAEADEATQAQARFETEARLLAELSHPGIPRIYSYFSEAGRHYIVMEYIEGETLELAVTHADPLGRTVAARPLPAEEVIRHAVRLCRVLEYLSDQPTPVVHQDVKPANLIVDRHSGEVRLVDFGTARARMRWATKARLEQRASTVFGTEGYAAPEQYQGLSDPCADVYALAATVYHLLTDDDPGDHPFQFPQLETLPSPLAQTLSRALHLEVGRRSVAAQFRKGLEAWLIPDEGARPFVFRSGAVAHATGELVNLCDKHWLEARRYLADGDFDRWFRDQNRHDLVAKAQSARLEPNIDAALETFLRRLDPRLPPPRLIVQPQGVSWKDLIVRREVGGSGDGTGRNPDARYLTLRNEGRGYAQVTLAASVPWVELEPIQLGCLAGAEATVTVGLDLAALPLRREQQAVITCTPVRGARVSIPVEVELNLVREALLRFFDALRPLLHVMWQGARQGFSLWGRTFRSLLRSRTGVGVLLVESVVLAAVMVVLWSILGEPLADPAEILGAFFWALPLSMVTVCVLPGLALVGGAAIWEVVRGLLRR